MPTSNFAAQPMPITAETITQIAALARVSLTPEEQACFTKNLGDIIGHMESLNAIDTGSIEPMYHAMDLHQRLDPDLIQETNQRALFQSVAPTDKEHKPTTFAGLYLVPKVID